MKLDIKKWTKPETGLIALVIVLLVLGVFLVPDYGYTSDEKIEKTRASIALSAYGLKAPYTRETYESIEHSKYYGTAFSMVFLYADEALTPIINQPTGIIRHYGYFTMFVLAAVAIFYLVKLFVNDWLALFSALFFTTQPLYFGHAFINPKDIPLLSIFLATVTIGFYIDRTPHWAKALSMPYSYKQLGEHLQQAWKALSQRKKRWGISLSIAFFGLFFSPQPLKTIITQVLTRAYTMPDTFLGTSLHSVAANIEDLPLTAYIDKAMRFTLRLRFLSLSGLGFLLLIGLLYLLIKNSHFARLRQNAILIHLTNPVLLAAGAIWGLAISTRAISLVAGGIVGLYFLWHYRSRAIWPLAIYTSIAGVASYISWPLYWTHGFDALINGLLLSANHTPFLGSVLFDGIVYPAKSLPASYLPKLLLIQFTIPLVILFGGGLIVWLVSWARKFELTSQRKQALLLLLWFGLPLFYIVWRTPILYDNFRQFLFITPPLFVFAALALNQIQQKLKRDWLFSLLLLATCAPGVIHIVSFHPYQYVYYNQFVGGVDDAFRLYEMDYLHTSMKEGMTYINALAPENSKIFIEGGWNHSMRYRREDLVLNKREYVDETEWDTFDYAVIDTQRNKDQRMPENWVQIDTISIGGADLIIIYEIISEP